MKYKKEKTRNVETRSVRAYYDRSRGSYCLILEDVDTQERVFTLPIYTNEPYRLEDPRMKDAKGNYHWTHGNPAKPFLKPAVADHAQQYRQIMENELKNG